MGVNSDFQAAASTLFREAFEGVPAGQNYTWVVEGKEGIFDALESADAERASVKPSASSASLAAHAFHLLYLLRAANTVQGFPKPEGTWNSSWLVETVTEEEWNDLKFKIKSEYELYLGWLSTNENWSEIRAFESVLAPVPHVFYHLGAMRQLLKVL